MERAHGTKACYLRGPGPGSGEGCRCLRCRKANTAFNVERERAIIRGEWKPWTDAAPVRAHVEMLIRSGLTQENVAALARVKPGSMSYLMKGASGRPPARHIRPEAAQRILAVQPLDVPAAGYVDSTGTLRRLRALNALGWPDGWLADQLPMQRANFSVMLRRTTVRVATANAVRELYDRLWNTEPPAKTPRDIASVTAAKARADSEGWPPPWAWNDHEIDNPAAKPAGGLASVLDDGQRHHGTDSRESFLELRSWGLSFEKAAERMDVSARTLLRWEADRVKAETEAETGQEVMAS